MAWPVLPVSTPFSSSATFSTFCSRLERRTMTENWLGASTASLLALEAFSFVSKAFNSLDWLVLGLDGLSLRHLDGVLHFAEVGHFAGW